MPAQPQYAARQPNPRDCQMSYGFSPAPRAVRNGLAGCEEEEAGEDQGKGGKKGQLAFSSSSPASAMTEVTVPVMNRASIECTP